MARGLQFTQPELDVIRLGLENGRKVSEIAKFLGRSRQSVYRRIDQMKESGDLHQSILDLGQCDDS